MNISEQKTANVLLDANERKYLEPFLNQATSVHNAASQLGIKINAMYYRAKKLEGLGLITSDEEIVEKRHRIKLYRATSNHFFVPFTSTSFNSFEDLLTQLADFPLFIDNAVKSLQTLASNWGIVIVWNNKSGRTDINIVPMGNAEKVVPVGLSSILSYGAPAFLGSSEHLYLDYPKAKALQKDLADLVTKYQSASSNGHQKYLLTLGLTPFQVSER